MILAATRLTPHGKRARHGRFEGRRRKSRDGDHGQGAARPKTVADYFSRDRTECICPREGPKDQLQLHLAPPVIAHHHGAAMSSPKLAASDGVRRGSSAHRFANSLAGVPVGTMEATKATGTTILEQDGRFMAVERPIDDVSESASGVGDGEGPGGIRRTYSLILLTCLRKCPRSRLVTTIRAPPEQTDRLRACPESNLKTVIPTCLPNLLSMECEVLAGTGGGVAVSGTGVHRGEGCGDTGDGHSGFGSGGVQRGVPEVADEAGEAGRAQAECGGGT